MAEPSSSVSSVGYQRRVVMYRAGSSSQLQFPSSHGSSILRRKNQNASWTGVPRRGRLTLEPCRHRNSRTAPYTNPPEHRRTPRDCSRRHSTTFHSPTLYLLHRTHSSRHPSRDTYSSPNHTPSPTPDAHSPALDCFPPCR